MPTNQQPDTAKLDIYYKHALDNSGKDQFYTFLYRYVDTVVTDDQLFAAAMRFWLESLAADFQKDKSKLEQFTDKATAFSNKPNLYQMTDFFVSMFGLIDKTKIKETKPYYCWYQLYNIFYGLRASSINGDIIKKIGNLDFKSKETKELLADIPITDKDISELKSLDFDKLAEAIELETQSVVPIKTRLSRDDYVSCLMVFHADFSDWLQTYSEQPTKEIEYIGNAEIYYKDYMTYVSLPNEKKSLKLRKLKIKPNSGYDYVLNYMFEPQNENNLITTKDIHKLSWKCEVYHNASEVLRHCGFNIALKRTFMPDRCDIDGFQYFKVRPVTQEQVDNIKEKTNKNLV